MTTKLFTASVVAIAALVVGATIGNAAQIEVPLKTLKGPNNSFNDSVYGVTMTYPAGWELVRAFRWGEHAEQTTIGLRRNRPSVATVSFFYQQFSPDSPRPAEIKVWFNDAFHKKEAWRKKEVRTYRNEPASLRFATTAAGLPKCSYMATFTTGSKIMVEYYIRIAGHESYVMFIAQGSAAEIDGMRGDIDRMADTVRVP